MGPLHRTERRKSMAERRPSVSYTPPVIPHLAGLEKPQDHSLKLDQCDVLIMGTGLSESVLAAALSWQGVETLHIDNKSYYGDLTSTLTIDQLKKWCVDVNLGQIQHFQDAQIYIPGGKATNRFHSKDYGVDLSPKIMFARSDLLSLLIKSRVYKYLEFQSLSNFHVFENDSFSKKISNTTKEHIFTDQSLSLITKRYLMKFLKFTLQDNNNPDKKKILLDNAKTPIRDFLSNQFHLNTPQINELVFSIGLCPKETTRTPEGLARIKRFLTSFDVYGNFPVMVLKYGGAGEISQGFCRSAAVAGTTYKLNTSLIDFDPQLKIAKFNDGSVVKINEKIVLSPTQIPKFLQSGYNELVEKLKLYYITRLITIVRKDCKEWIAEHESSAVVVFPPHSLPTDNQQGVQVIIQNGESDVCPKGQSIWYSHTTEQDLAKAKIDLESAFKKMEYSILRESSSDLDDVLEDQEFAIGEQGTPVVTNSFKLGQSLQNFVPRETLDIVCKLGYVQSTYIKPDLSNIISPKDSSNVSLATLPDAEDIIFSNMPSSEITYDGIVGEAKILFSRITGSNDDFFDVDFEDDDDDYNQGSTANTSGVTGVARNGSVALSDDENAIMDSDDDHKPFAADEMEL
ncbi:uncharacterized protein PRCAT00004648001 [Priceomyces carsonii]|uniref:uncharacterized protein n=1 Tax=Priceomyces carsonii TaxID=28549 RepID=UPI002ED790B0|nr:unnamed protein product [Priceomyces carsonii]